MKDKSQILLATLIGIVTALIIGLSAYLFFFSVKPIEIIDFNSSSIVSIDNWAKENEITIDYKYEYSEEIEKDLIISTSLTSDTVLYPKDEITITLSLGSDPTKEITLIDFTGYDEQKIQEFCDENKLLDVSFEYEYNDDIEENLFIKHNIENETVKRTDMLVFTMSNGKEPVVIVEIEVPDFSKYKKSEITNWSKANGVKIKYAYSTSKTIEKDGFIKQSISSKSKITQGKTITITYSLGKPIEMIDLSGKTKSEVVKWFESYDNRIEANYIESYSDKVEKGKVISNKPNSGTVEDGDKIDVYISIGQASIDNYVGKSFDSLKSAVETLNKKGANITISAKEEDSATVSKGNVISQDKSGTITIGTKITVVYSKGKTVTVPNGKNMSLDNFKQALNNANLTLGTKTEMYSTEIAKGNIISNDKAATTVYEKTTINYVVSLGNYVVENMVGKKVEEAQALLDKAAKNGATKYTISTTEAFDNTTNLKKGLIVSQSISGSTLNLIVSKGQSVIVSNFVGKIKDSSAETVEGYSKLTVTWVSDGYDENKKTNEVTSQSINSGTEVEVGTKIELHYSLGPSAKGILPAFTGMDFNTTDASKVKNQVESSLSSLGFTNFTVTIVDLNDSPGFVVRMYNTSTDNDIEPGSYPLDYPIGIWVQQ